MERLRDASAPIVAYEAARNAGTQRFFTSSMTARRQSSLFSEKALFKIEIQLRNTTPTHPVRPAKNMTSRMSLLQSISLYVMDANHQHSRIGL
jgi:hypothetical protein